MARHPVDWVDAFADHAFAGNPCAVVHDAEAMPVADRLALVRETKTSECAFLVPSDAADFGARYYLADREIPFAGHPTVAVGVSLVDRGLVDVAPGASVEIALEVGAGIVPVTLSRDAEGRIHVSMRQRAPEFGAEQDPAEIAGIYGLDPADLVGAPRIVSTGNPFCVTLLADRPALDRARLDLGRLEAWRAGTGLAEAGLMEPFLCVLGGADGGDVLSRLLMAPPLPAEDAFTGSATGSMAAHLFERGRVPRRFVAEQGVHLGRPGRADVEVLGPPDAIEGVRVTGAGVVLMSGELRL